VQAQQLISCGIGVASAEALVAGAAALPNPGQDGQDPPRGWLYKAARVLTYQNSSSFGVEDYTYPVFSFDIRSARLVDKGVLFIQLTNGDLFGTPMIVRVAGMVRSLILT